MHPNCVAVDAILERAGLDGRVRILDEAAPTAAAAAALVGVEVGAIANSLVFATAEGGPLLVLTSGVAPVGHPAPLPTIVDTALAEHPRIWAAGGIPHAVFPTTYGELVTLTGGLPADVA